MSGSSTPVSSNRSYADVRAQSKWQARVNELLAAKGVKPRGVQAEKAMEVAWRYTKEELAAWRAGQEPTPPPPALLASRSSQPTLHDFFPSA